VSWHDYCVNIYVLLCIINQKAMHVLSVLALNILLCVVICTARMPRLYHISALIVRTIKHVKQEIKQTAGIPEDEQRILLACKQLEDDKTLSHYNINSESVLHVVLKLRGC
jgi:Ubiquitin family